ncbi:MAG: ATP cone domain-containing protein [Candidatus Nanohaloarchaea archaeon]|nr:ATP cone domain-containing protein [Candidatus Nanohaloarchaea archaeon]
MEILITRDGEKEEFDQRKLYSSIYYPARVAEYDEQDAEDLAEDVCQAVVERVEEQEEPVVTSDELREMTIEELEDRDEEVAFLYDTHLDIN